MTPCILVSQKITLKSERCVGLSTSANTAVLEIYNLHEGNIVGYKMVCVSEIKGLYLFTESLFDSY